MAGPGHVRAHEVHPSVVVDVGQVAFPSSTRACGAAPRRVTSVNVPSPLPLYKLVRAVEVIRDVEVGVSVPVVIPPGGGEALVVPCDARLGGDVGERAVAVVAIQVVVLGGSDDPAAPAGVDDDIDELAMFLGDGVGAIGVRRRVGKRGRRLDAVGDEEGVEIAVAIIVCEGGHDTGPT